MDSLVYANYVFVGDNTEDLIRCYKIFHYYHKHTSRLLSQLRKVCYISTIVNPNYYFYGYKLESIEVGTVFGNRNI